VGHRSTSRETRSCRSSDAWGALTSNPTAFMLMHYLTDGNHRSRPGRLLELQIECMQILHFKSPPHAAPTPTRTNLTTHATPHPKITAQLLIYTSSPPARQFLSSPSCRWYQSAPRYFWSSIWCPQPVSRSMAVLLLPHGAFGVCAALRRGRLGTTVIRFPTPHSRPCVVRADPNPSTSELDSAARRFQNGGL
jgi:hypothetical protein